MLHYVYHSFKKIKKFHLQSDIKYYIKITSTHCIQYKNGIVIKYFERHPSKKKNFSIE